MKNPGNINRYEANPILTAKDFPGPIRGVYNSAITKLGSEYIMICRVEDKALRQYMWVARSQDGYSFFPDPAPIRMPENEYYLEGSAGTVYDPRITYLDGTYYVVHAAADAEFRSRLAMLQTDDFETFNFVSFPGSANTRNGVLFPERINGDYVMMERDAAVSGGDIWLTYSKDLVHWGRTKVMYKREQEYWHYYKVGAGATPIKTERGWLNIFHGVHKMCESQLVYHLGVMLLDSEDPSKVLASCPFAVLSPEEEYEITGLTPNVVFTCGAWVEEDRSVKLYYGAADTVQCVADTTVDDLLAACDMSRDGWAAQLRSTQVNQIA